MIRWICPWSSRHRRLAVLHFMTSCCQGSLRQGSTSPLGEPKHTQPTICLIHLGKYETLIKPPTRNQHWITIESPLNHHWITIGSPLNLATTTSTPLSMKSGYRWRSAAPPWDQRPNWDPSSPWSAWKSLVRNPWLEIAGSQPLAEFHGSCTSTFLDVQESAKIHHAQLHRSISHQDIESTRAWCKSSMQNTCISVVWIRVLEWMYE